jgi:hypothetical protein
MQFRLATIEKNDFFLGVRPGWILLLLTAMVVSVRSPAAAQEIAKNSKDVTIVREWRFDSWNNREGWNVPETLNGAVHGGTLWLTLRPPLKPEDAGGVLKQTYADASFWMESPKGLKISSNDVNQVRIRLLNRSSETDGAIAWRTVEAADKDVGVASFAMEPYSEQWQEVVCYLDGRSNGAIDQIRLRPGTMFRRGEIWIDRIVVAKGPPRPVVPRPDICSDRVIPRIELPGVSQSDFAEAFKVLNECLVVDVPIAGFEQPFLAPGGAYGQNWWQLDGSLNLAGSKWANQTFAENVIRGFISVQAQNPDGRIDLWGGAPARGAPADLSSLPRYFEAAYDIARRSKNPTFRERVYRSMRAYLDWWLSPVKRDRKTGLITGIAEETFGVDGPAAGLIGPMTPQRIAPVDLNVAVVIGCRNVADLAKRMSYVEDAKRYQNSLVDLTKAIDAHLWNSSREAYCSYDLVEGKLSPLLNVATFDALLLDDLPPNRIHSLLAKLTDPALFNWGGACLATVAKTEPGYVEVAGPYRPAAWSGDVWTMRNLPVIAGLERIGRHDLAAALTWRTICVFNRNWAEFVKTSSGTGQGVQRYGWSASQYLQAIIEHLFGVDYDSMNSRLTVFPHIPDELLGKTIRLDHLRLPTNEKAKLSLSVVRDANGGQQQTLEIDGPLPTGTIEFRMAAKLESVPPKAINAMTGESLTVSRDRTVPGVFDVRLPIQRTFRIHWKSNVQ